ncbi:hypothetical protein EPO15_11485 [bacterium]|nr:MAG: hypothetical protein EPO15_11485 [bacterium]
MRLPSAILSAFLSLPAQAQFRVALPTVPVAPVAPRLAAPTLSVPTAAVSVLPAAPRLAATLPTAAAPVVAAPMRAANGVTVPDVGPAAVPAPPTPQDLDYVSGAAFALGQAADDLGAESGLRVSKMGGADFIALVEEARRRLDAAAGSTRADAAAKDVRAAVLRVVRALVKPELPMSTQAPRLMSVWQVMTQELSRAAEAGTLEAVVKDAALFAEQVEASI